ncbi:hypothetical protein HHI36_014656 [Cryptolaemus montrouzieri]|uniref:Uncharacterized protein n=1 Tax=Cryptolaemus montrouzieri TaxID=559131 RepID=A0ABD2N477_9CUCU
MQSEACAKIRRTDGIVYFGKDDKELEPGPSNYRCNTMDKTDDDEEDDISLARVRIDEQLYKTLKSRLKSAIDSSIRSGHCGQLANVSNKSREIWKIINAEVKEPKSMNVNSSLNNHTLCDHFANVAMRYTPENLDQNESPQSDAKKTASSDYNSIMLTDTTAIEIM